MRERSGRRRRLERDRWTSPLGVLLIGRLRKNRGGGIARSARLIAEALVAAGDRVTLQDVREPLTELPPETDVVWHYGDLDGIEVHQEVALRADVPFLVNSGFDDTTEQIERMQRLLTRWDPTGARPIFWVVFTTGVLADPRLRGLAGRVVALPKPIRADLPEPPPFSAREGVCVGELAKLGRERLVRGLDIDEALRGLREALPGVPLFAYDQYGTAETRVPEGVIRVPAPGDGFGAWLARLRLFVSLARHETFAMVPMEAQLAGTPLLYRPMPQSLTEYAGHAGFPFASVRELCVGARKLYVDRRAWETLSQAGHLSARARALPLVGSALDLALRKLVFGREAPGRPQVTVTE